MSCLQDDVEIRRKAVPISLSVNLHSRNTQSMQVSHTSCYGMYSRKIWFFFPVSSIKLRRVLWVTNTAWVKAVRHWLLATKTQLMTWVATNLIHPTSFSVAFCMKGLSGNLNGMRYLHTRPVKPQVVGCFNWVFFLILCLYVIRWMRLCQLWKQHHRSAKCLVRLLFTIAQSRKEWQPHKLPHNSLLLCVVTTPPLGWNEVASTRWLQLRYSIFLESIYYPTAYQYPWTRFSSIYNT